MKIKNYKKSEKGFIVVLAILVLLVMSLMGTTLVVIASNDHKGNTLRDYNQQTFYAAETGIQEAKEYLNQQVQKGVTLKPYDIGPLNFCKTSFFPSLSDNMSYVKAIGPDGSSARKGLASLSHLIYFLIKNYFCCRSNCRQYHQQKDHIYHQPSHE